MKATLPAIFALLCVALGADAGSISIELENPESVRPDMHLGTAGPVAECARASVDRTHQRNRVFTHLSGPDYAPDASPNKDGTVYRLDINLAGLAEFKLFFDNRMRARNEPDCRGRAPELETAQIECMANTGSTNARDNIATPSRQNDHINTRRKTYALAVTLEPTGIALVVFTGVILLLRK